MKEAKEKLGYQIKEEFEEMKERFREISWIFIVAYLLCVLLLCIEMGITNEWNTALKSLFIFQIIVMVLGVIFGIWFYIESHLKNRDLCFSINIFWLLVCARVYFISVAIMMTCTYDLLSAEGLIGEFLIGVAIMFMIGDVIRVYHKYSHGDYNEEAEAYVFEWGRLEKAVVTFVVVTTFPVLFRGIRLTLHYSSIPQDVLNMYGVYLMCLIFCLTSRISLKAFINLRMCGRKRSR